MTFDDLRLLERRYTPEPGLVPGCQRERHRKAASEALGEVYRHRLGKDGDYPEIGVVEVQRAHGALAFAYAECDEYKSAIDDVLKLCDEVRKLKVKLGDAE